jgi:hypothetical protein
LLVVDCFNPQVLAEKIALRPRLGREEALVIWALEVEFLLAARAVILEMDRHQEVEC